MLLDLAGDRCEPPSHLQQAHSDVAVRLQLQSWVDVPRRLQYMDVMPVALS